MQKVVYFTKTSFKIYYFKATILKNRCDIVETTCLMVLSLAFIIEKSQEFLIAKSEMFESESKLKLSKDDLLRLFAFKVKLKLWDLC